MDPIPIYATPVLLPWESHTNSDIRATQRYGLVHQHYETTEDKEANDAYWQGIPKELGPDGKPIFLDPESLVEATLCYEKQWNHFLSTERALQRQEMINKVCTSENVEGRNEARILYDREITCQTYLGICYGMLAFDNAPLYKKMEHRTLGERSVELLTNASYKHQQMSHFHVANRAAIARAKIIELICPNNYDERVANISLLVDACYEVCNSISDKDEAISVLEFIGSRIPHRDYKSRLFYLTAKANPDIYAGDTRQTNTKEAYKLAQRFLLEEEIHIPSELKRFLYQSIGYVTAMYWKQKAKIAERLEKEEGSVIE